MPINKTELGTFTLVNGDGYTSSNPIIWNSLADSSGRHILNLKTTESQKILWVLIKLKAGVQYNIGLHDWEYQYYFRLYDSTGTTILANSNWWYGTIDGTEVDGRYFSYTPSVTDNYLLKIGDNDGYWSTFGLHISVTPEIPDVKKIYETSPNFDDMGYMVDFFSLEDAEIKAPVVATGGLDFNLNFQNGLTESLTGITGTIEDNTYFELANDDTVGNYLLCKKIYGSQKKVVFNGTENMFQYGTGDFSISFWLKAPNFTGFGKSVLSKHNGNTGFSIYNTSDNSSDSTMEIRVSQSNSNTDLSTDAISNTWTHWLFMRENNTGYWYKNGTKISQTAMGEKNINNNSPLCIGFTNCAPYYGADFGITSIKIYGKILKDYEINGLSREFRI